MENLEVVVRGMVMQNAGLQQGSVIFQGMELLWVLVVATIVLAVVSVTRVSVVSVGWTWGSKPGHVRVRVQSFLADGALVGSPGAMFSAEILNCSADSCSEDASSSADCGEKRAEMVFIFDENGASLVTRATTTTTATVLEQPQLLSHAPPPRAAPNKIITRTQPKAQENQTHEEAPLVSSAQLIEGAISLPRRERIGWDFTSPTNSLESSSGVGLAEPLAASFVSRSPSSPLLLRAVRNRSASACEWCPLLKLRIRDAVLSDGGSGNFTAPLAPLAIHGSSSAVTTLKDEVVRVWDTDSKSLLRSVRLPAEGDAVATAFDVNWESKLVALARKGGVIAVANLECGAYEERFQTQQPVVQAIHVDRASLSKNLFTGGPASAHAGCSVSIYDCRSSTRQQLSFHLPTTTNIYDLHSHDHNLYLRDRSNSLAAHDVRMLKPYPVNRLPCRIPNIAIQDRWWDNFDQIISQGDLEEDDDDDDDDFSIPFACMTSEGGASSMGRNFVIGMSRSFSTKPPSH